MKITCLIFGKYAEVVGTDKTEFELPEGASLVDAIQELRDTLPNGSRIPASTMVAINQVHALPTRILEEGDELALLPPLAGG